MMIETITIAALGGALGVDSGRSGDQAGRGRRRAITPGQEAMNVQIWEATLRRISPEASLPAVASHGMTLFFPESHTRYIAMMAQRGIVKQVFNKSHTSPTGQHSPGRYTFVQLVDGSWLHFSRTGSGNGAKIRATDRYGRLVRGRPRVPTDDYITPPTDYDDIEGWYDAAHMLKMKALSLKDDVRTREARGRKSLIVLNAALADGKSMTEAVQRAMTALKHGVHP